MFDALNRLKEARKGVMLTDMCDRQAVFVVML